MDERLKKLGAGETMFVAGAIGGVQPNHDNSSEDSYFVRKIGEDLADQVAEILKHLI